MGGRVRTVMIPLLLAATLTVTGVGPAAATVQGRSAVAVATIRDGSGGEIGRAAFVQLGRGAVHVLVIAFGLRPGLHGLHVHAVGSCVGPTFTSAGPHFNPLNASHGAHAGDLPDLVVGASGIGMLSTSTSSFTLTPGALSLFDVDGAAIAIHADPDDHVTNPAGNSGARIACGVISRIV